MLQKLKQKGRGSVRATADRPQGAAWSVLSLCTVCHRSSASLLGHVPMHKALEVSMWNAGHSRGVGRSRLRCVMSWARRPDTQWY